MSNPKQNIKDSIIFTKEKTTTKHNQFLLYKISISGYRIKHMIGFILITPDRHFQVIVNVRNKKKANKTKTPKRRQPTELICVRYGTGTPAGIKEWVLDNIDRINKKYTLQAQD